MLCEILFWCKLLLCLLYIVNDLLLQLVMCEFLLWCKLLLCLRSMLENPSICGSYPSPLLAPPPSATAVVPYAFVFC